MNTYNILKNICLSIINVDFYHCDTGWYFLNVNSPFSRLYLIKAGKATITHNGQVYTLEPGVLHLVPCHTPHDCHCPEWFDVFFVHFNAQLSEGIDLLTVHELPCHLRAGQWEDTLFRRLLELNRDKPLLDQDPYHAQRQMRYSQDEHYESPGAALQSQGIMRLLLAPFFDAAEKTIEPSRLQAIHRFGHLLSFIEKNLTKPITLGELGDLAGLEPGYFSKVFYKTMGVRPIEFINRKRIEKAQRLLLTTTDNLDTIARHVGFSNWVYLSRVFKKQIGMTPGQYRKQKNLFF